MQLRYTDAKVRKIIPCLQMGCIFIKKLMSVTILLFGRDEFLDKGMNKYLISKLLRKNWRTHNAFWLFSFFQQKFELHP